MDHETVKRLQIRHSNVPLANNTDLPALEVPAVAVAVELRVEVAELIRLSPRISQTVELQLWKSLDGQRWSFANQTVWRPYGRAVTFNHPDGTEETNPPPSLSVPVVAGEFVRGRVTSSVPLADVAYFVFEAE